MQFPGKNNVSQYRIKYTLQMRKQSHNWEKFAVKHLFKCCSIYHLQSVCGTAALGRVGGDRWPATGDRPSFNEWAPGGVGGVETGTTLKECRWHSTRNSFLFIFHECPYSVEHAIRERHGYSPWKSMENTPCVYCTFPSHHLAVTWLPVTAIKWGLTIPCSWHLADKRETDSTASSDHGRERLLQTVQHFENSSTVWHEWRARLPDIDREVVWTLQGLPVWFHSEDGGLSLGNPRDGGSHLE